MKRKHSTLFTTAINAATLAINAAQGVFQELNVTPGETTIRYRLSPFGEFPVDDVNGKPIIQVVDAKAGETMAINFGSLGTRLATFFKGIPMYEGHPDDAEWLRKNPGHKAIALARIKSMENQVHGDENDGIYVTAVLNSKGVEKLTGDAPEYTGHSPNWRLAEIPGRPGCYRPILLWSDGLTNTPNILNNTIALNSLAGMEIDVEVNIDSPDAGNPGATENQNQNDMKLTPDALKALGFAPDASPTVEEISAAIVKLASDQATAAADLATAQSATTAANSRATNLETELGAIRGAAVETVLTDAVNQGRITQADVPMWTNALNASFISERTKLMSLVPVMNTTGKVTTGERRNPTMVDASNAISAITEGVRSYAIEKGIDIATTTGWDRAYAACKAERPELFKA